jgi:hypothetical protein
VTHAAIVFASTAGKTGAARQPRTGTSPLPGSKMKRASILMAPGVSQTTDFIAVPCLARIIFRF